VRYLAAGRPVVVQDTGFTRQLPTGEGLLCFRTPAEAATAASEILENFVSHSEAALRVAGGFLTNSVESILT
jgi:hypothetical protein